MRDMPKRNAAPQWCLDWFIASRRAQSEVIFTNMSTYLAMKNVNQHQLFSQLRSSIIPMCCHVPFLFVASFPLVRQVASCFSPAMSPARCRRFHCSDIQSPKATPATVVQSDFIRSSISSGHMDYMLFSLYIIIYGYRYRYYRYYISNRIVRMTCCEITCRFSALHEVYRSPTMSHCQHDELLSQPFLRQNWRISFEGNTCHL